MFVMSLISLTTTSCLVYGISVLIYIPCKGHLFYRSGKEMIKVVFQGMADLALAPKSSDSTLVYPLTST